MLISFAKLLAETFDLPAKLCYHFVSGIVIDSRLICYVGSLCSVGKGGEIFIDEGVIRTNASNHQAIAVSSDRLFKNRC
jgi:hypothetical protein